jgi:hypothetical protein
MFASGAAVLNSIRAWLGSVSPRESLPGHRTPKGVPGSLWLAIYKHPTPPE